MATKNQILDYTPLGMKFTVLQTAADTEGKSLDLYWELLPQCNMDDPTPHIHPHAIETYEILEGEMEFFVKDKWIPAKKGDNIRVEKGVTHAFRNPTNKIVKVYNTHQPALKMENYFEDGCKVIDKVTDNRQKPFRMNNLKTMLYFCVLANNYRKEIIYKSPPDKVIKIFGFIGKLIGLKY